MSNLLIKNVHILKRIHLQSRTQWSKVEILEEIFTHMKDQRIYFPPMVYVSYFF